MSYKFDYAMSSTKDRFVHRRHDEVRDLFATLLKDICHDVEFQPHLQTLKREILISSANSNNEARLDISEAVFGQGSKVHFSMSFTKSHLNQKLDMAFSSKEKNRHYNQQVIEVEHGSFSPHVLTHHMEEIAEKPNDFSLN